MTFGMLPREKITSLGVESLTVSELFAILLGSGSRNQTVFEMSDQITSSLNFRKSFLEQRIEYWTKIPGIGPTKASRIVAGVELSKRMLFQKNEETTIRNSKDVFAHLRTHILGKGNEGFFLICLDTKNRILFSKEIHSGFCNTVITDMKMIFSTVLQTGALSFICAHNHPSGDVQPSDDDRELTQKIMNASKVLDLCFLDHLIITSCNYYSLFENEPELFKNKT